MSNPSTNWEDVYRVQRDRIDELLQKTQGLERENATLREALAIESERSLYWRNIAGRKEAQP